MLILSRRAGQLIMLGDDIQISVLAIYSHQVRLGFTAPAELRIEREERYKMAQEKQRQKDLDLLLTVG